MARGKTKYAGIEIEFTANYAELATALKEIDVKSKSLSKDLKETQAALEFDPGNVELAASNQRLLAAAIENTTERLKLLKSTEDEVKAAFDKGQIPAEQYAKYQTEIAKTERALETFKAQQSENGAELIRLRDKLSEAETALKGYNAALKDGTATSEGLIGEALENRISDTAKRIEIYQAKIKELLSQEHELRDEETGLTQATMELARASEEAANANEKMSGGYSVTKNIIADLATSVIRKTTSALIDFTKGSLEAASSLYEVENVVDVAFENMRGKVDDFSSTAIEYYGISELTAKRTASLFAAMGKGMDLTLDKATDLAIGLAKRSADMASFYDISQEITSTALKSVFTGETESLKRFGVVMTEVNLQQYALSQGIEKSIKDMTQAEKVQLRYNYLMQQTASSEGDFARTADSFANKTRQLKERLVETSVAIGERFIKNLDGAFTTLDELLEKVNEATENGDLDDFIKDISDILKNLLSVLSAVGGVLARFPKLTAATAAGFTALKAANKVKAPIEGAANAFNKLAFNMSGATEQGKLFASELSHGVGTYAVAATAAISLGMALADYIDRLAEAKRNQQLLSDEQEAAIKEAKDLTATYEENSAARKENIENIEAEYQSLRSSADTLIELANKSEKSSKELSTMVSTAEMLNESMKGLGLEIDETTGAMNMQGEELLRLIDSYENLAKAEATKSALSEAYEEQAKATAKLNNINNQRYDIIKKLDDAETRYAESVRILNTMRHGDVDAYSVEELEKQEQATEQAKAELEGYKNALTALTVQYTEYASQLRLAEEDIKALNDLYDKAKDGSEEAAQKLAEATEELKEQAEALKELESAYSDAGSAVSNYRSSIADLVKLQNDLAAGTEMSTLEMLDMIEKYPELIGQIKATENGYTLEKEAIEQLIEARLANLKLAARERQEAAEGIFLQQGGSRDQLNFLKRAFDQGQIKDITQLQGKEYAAGLYDAIDSYAQTQGINSLVSDIMTNGMKEGAKAEKEATASSTKSTKATIAEAETLITALEHKYKQGLISAETYYKDLDRIAKEYYGNQGGYLERYMELEDEAQAGIKKAIEDRAKSYQDLEGSINDVIDAQKALKGIESNKSVLAYSEAGGFRLEADQEALANASKNLAEAQRQLMLSLADMSGGSGIYGAFADKLADETGKALKEILPDLTSAYGEAAEAEELIPTQQSYTFNFGDIKTSGDAGEFKRMLSDFVDMVINETQII